MKKLAVTLLLIGFIFSCSKDEENVPNEVTCDSVAKMMTEKDFNEINTSNYTVMNIQLNGDCLEVSIRSSGCDPEPWEIDLFSTNVFNTDSPLQRAVKIRLINLQLCQAVFQKSDTFDLTPFRIDGQNVVPINIEGWYQQILYEY